MRTIQVEITDKLAEELDTMLQEGWFQTQEEAVRFAILQLVESQRLALQERFQREDIEWALSTKKVAT